MLYGDENITLKQLAFLLVGSRFKRCEVWNEEEYLATHRNKKFLKQAIASKKIELLQEEGLSFEVALKRVCLEGEQKVNRKNLSLLGKPIWKGNIDELSNRQDLYGRNIRSIHITGLFRNKIDIVLKENSVEIKEEDYLNWLENMLTMLSKNYLDLVRASDEKTLMSVPLPVCNATRKAIRLISQNARLTIGKPLEDNRVEQFTQVLIRNQHSKLLNETDF